MTIDLSTLQPKTLPADQSICAVTGGCGLRLRNVVHGTLMDCVKTTTPYVELYLQLDPALQQLEAELGQALESRQSVLKANQTLAEDNDRLRAEVARLKAS